MTKEDRTPRDWFRVERPKAQAGVSSADVYIYDAIGGWFGIQAQDFVQAISALDVQQLNLYVNSPGGDVFDATAMTNALRRHPANVTATVDGLAASAASFLITAADEVVMGQGSTLMIHDAWSFAMGNADDLRDTADILDKLSNNIAALYAAKAGGTASDWRQVMQDEAWFNADEAVEAGLADRVAETESDGASNVFDLSVFAHAGRDAAPEPPIARLRAAAALHPRDEHMRTAAKDAALKRVDADARKLAEEFLAGIKPVSPTGETTTQDEPAHNQKEDVVTDTTDTKAPVVEQTPEPQAMTALDISNAVTDGLKPFFDAIQDRPQAVIPGVPDSFTPAKPKGMSYAEAMNLLTARASGMIDGEQRKAIEATFTPAHEVFAALTNISTGDATHGGVALTTPPQWIGELVDQVPYDGLWNHIQHDNLTSTNVQAWQMTTKPTGGDKADGGAAVTSTGARWQLKSFTAARWAGADSFDRAGWDFGIQASALSSYNRVQLRNYYIWRDVKLITALTTDVSAVDASAAPDGSAISAITGAILDGVVNVLNQGGGLANLAALNIADYKELIKNSREQSPAFVTLDLGALSQGDVEGKITVRPDLTATITAGDALVANGSGVTGYELPGSPVRAEQIQVSIGNIDYGLFGYALAVLDSPNYVSLVSQGS